GEPVGGQAGLGPRLAGGVDQEAGGAARGRALAGGPPRQLLDLAAPGHPEVAHREVLDLGDPAGAGNEPGPEGVEVLADRADDAGAGHRDRLSWPGPAGWPDAALNHDPPRTRPDRFYPSQRL